MMGTVDSLAVEQHAAAATTHDGRGQPPGADDPRIRLLDQTCALASATKAEAVHRAYRAGLDPVTVARISCTPIDQVYLILAEMADDHG